MPHSSFIIAAPLSDSGKSTITTGLLRCLQRRGLEVQPFKCGPDYLDPKLHAIAAGRSSINLDLFMYSEEDVRDIYRRYDSRSQASIVEGVMGLFDGYDRDLGSAAHIARTLQLPIVLVISPRSMAYSVAPLLYGLRHFDPSLQIVGVIFNQVNSEAHYSYLCKACEDVGIPVLGRLPKVNSLVMPSRYLGLETEDTEQISNFADEVADLIEEHISVEDLLTATQTTISAHDLSEQRHDQLRIAVAQDEAFNFIYPENIRLLSAYGSITHFSPIRDTVLPKCDFLYLPGGYPELYLPQLADNQPMITGIRTYAEHGGRLLAECGGMLYLSKAMIDAEGYRYPMVGILDQEGTMEQSRLTIGYRQMELLGVPVRGHEFHYSRVLRAMPSLVQQYNAAGQPVPTALLRYRNVMASYTHLAFSGRLLDQLLYLSEER